MKKEFKIGLLVTVALALLIWGFNFLQGNNLFSTNRVYYAVYDHVDGLVAANPVIIRGTKVGQVSSVRFNNDNYNQILVELTFHQAVPLNDHSIAQIMSSDLLGSKAVEIKLNSGAPLQIGDTLVSDIEEDLATEVNKQLAPLKNKLENMVGSIDSVLVTVSKILDKDTRKNMKKVFENLRDASSGLEQMMNSNKGNFKSIMDNIATITDALGKNSDSLGYAIGNLKTVTDTLAASNLKATIDNLAVTLKHTSSILEKVDNGEGSMGKLVNNKELYNNLKNALMEVELLANDFHNNPHRYIHVSLVDFNRDKSNDSKRSNQPSKKKVDSSGEPE